MMEERYHATAQNRFYPDMSNVNKNITVEAKLINQLTYLNYAIHNRTFCCSAEMSSRYISSSHCVLDLKFSELNILQKLYLDTYPNAVLCMCIRGLSVKYPAILNIWKTGRVSLM